MATLTEKSQEVMEDASAECEHQAEDFGQLVSEVSESFQKYCSQRPGVMAGILFGLGFFCGWKLKPW